MSLNRVPSLCYLGVVAIQFYGRVHLLLHPVVYLQSEHIAKDARSHHDYEEDYQDDKVGEQHALDLLVGTKGAQKRYDGYDASGHDQNGRRGHVEVRSKETLHEGPIVESPNSDGEYNHSADLFYVLG